MQKVEQLREWLPLVEDLAGGHRESSSHADRSNADDNQLLAEDVRSTKQSGKMIAFYCNYSADSFLTFISCSLLVKECSVSL